MKLSTIKYPSGREVSLTAFLLTMTSVDVGAARRLSINRGKSSVPDAGTPSSNNQEDVNHERRSFQEKVEPIQGSTKVVADNQFPSKEVLSC